MVLEGHIEVCAANLISGWARDADAPDAKLRLEVCVAGEVLGSCVAEQARDDLERVGKGRCGFAFVPAAKLTPQARDRVVVRAAGSRLVLVNNHGGPQPDPFAGPPVRPGTRFRRAVLHIGTEKTGSTSLQRFLAINREELRARGVHVPRALAPEATMLNHSDLVAIAMADWRGDDGLRVARGIRGAAGLERARAEAEAAFAAEMADVPAGCTTMLVSSEHCHSRLLLLHEVAFVRRFLAPYCGQIDILVYLRPQHELASSQYGMHLMAGLHGAEMLPVLPYPAEYPRPRITSPEYFDYASLLSRWSAIFGREHVHPVLVERGTQAAQDVAGDVLSRLGVSGDGLAPAERLAGNISARAQKFMEGFNRAVTARDPGSAVWAAQWVAERLRRSEPGRGVRPEPTAIAAFMAQVAAGNERVRAEWFPGRASLFAAAPGEPDTVAQDEALSCDAMFDILAGLVLAGKGGPKRV